MPEKTVRRGTLSVISEERGHYTFQVAGDLDGMEWVWILLHAIDRVRTSKHRQLEVGRAIEETLNARKVG